MSGLKARISFCSILWWFLDTGSAWAQNLLFSLSRGCLSIICSPVQGNACSSEHIYAWLRFLHKTLPDAISNCKWVSWSFLCPSRQVAFVYRYEWSLPASTIVSLTVKGSFHQILKAWASWQWCHLGPLLPRRTHPPAIGHPLDCWALRSARWMLRRSNRIIM